MLEGERRALLAVSGGSDSLALLLLAVRWARELASDPPKLYVASVDHALRPEAAEEARLVAGVARRLGLEHATLVWTGEKPLSGLPAAAREARYRLLCAEARRVDATVLLTAHTISDQAETLLMRLARGSGVDGLSAMAAESRVEGIRLIRPLLGISRERLRAALLAAGQAWIEDPTNENESQERVRLRKAAGLLEGLGLSAAAIATSARRLNRAREALEAATAALARTAVRLDPAGYVEIDRRAMAEAPDEIALRLLGSVLEWVGAAARPAGLAQVEEALAALRPAGAGAMTLGGCRLVPGRVSLGVLREAGRRGLPAVTLAPGGSVIWDGRFAIDLDATEPAPVEVRAPTPQELRSLADAGRWRRGSLPLLAARTAPAVFRDGSLLAAPLHGFPGAARIAIDTRPYPRGQAAALASRPA